MRGHRVLLLRPASRADRRSAICGAVPSTSRSRSHNPVPVARLAAPTPRPRGCAGRRPGRGVDRFSPRCTPPCPRARHLRAVALCRAFRRRALNAIALLGARQPGAPVACRAGPFAPRTPRAAVMGRSFSHPPRSRCPAPSRGTPHPSCPNAPSLGAALPLPRRPITTPAPRAVAGSGAADRAAPVLLDPRRSRRWVRLRQSCRARARRADGRDRRQAILASPRSRVVACRRAPGLRVGVRLLAPAACVSRLRQPPAPCRPAPVASRPPPAGAALRPPPASCCLVLAARCCLGPAARSCRLASRAPRNPIPLRPRLGESWNPVPPGKPDRRARRGDGLGVGQNRLMLAGGVVTLGR